MNAPTPAVRCLGRRLLILELERGTARADGHQDATAVAAAAERAAQKLRDPLSRLVGVSGFRALQARALNLAGREWPILDGVRPAATPAGGLEGLREALQGADTEQASDALAAVLAHLVWLLVTFIGDDLAMRTVGEAWPAAELGHHTPPDTGHVRAQRSDTQRADGRQPRASRTCGEVGHGGAEATS
ncbi:MAG: hypothetical protein M3442_11640 [Chloroflexota bacterium]|nr:hypothetical protein [Chloroflexota bacterium]